MAYSQTLADALRDILDGAGIKSTFENREEFGVFTVRMKLNCKLQSAQVLVLVREDNFSALATIPLSADETSRLAVAEYLTRANFNMRNGNFEMSMETGEIRFKTYVHVGDGPVDKKAAHLAVMMPFLMLNRYGDGLLEVLFGFKSPREAFEAVGS